MQNRLFDQLNSSEYAVTLLEWIDVHHKEEEMSELSGLIEDVQGVIRNINQYVNRMEGLANSMVGLNF